MANGNDDFYDEYDFPPEEELFPMERAESAVMLAQEMKRTEDELPIEMGFAMAPQAPVVSAPLPEQTAQDRRAAYDMAIRRQDDRAALSAYQNMAAAGEGMPGVISIRSDLQPIPEPVSPAQMQYEAQRSYMDEINRGVPQQNAFAKYGPLMFPPSTKATAQAKNIMPVPMEWPPGSGKYVLVNPETGAVHTPGSTAEEKAGTTLAGAIQRKLIGAVAELAAEKSKKVPDQDELIRLQSIVDSLKNQLKDLNPAGVNAPETTREYGAPKTVRGLTMRKIIR